MTPCRRCAIPTASPVRLCAMDAVLQSMETYALLLDQGRTEHEARWVARAVEAGIASAKAVQ